ncbi:MAG: c-type cytochrome [Acidobacteria bacterium]|nr:c-type cytochrome [Acidobacteriota bacterium]
MRASLSAPAVVAVLLAGAAFAQVKRGGNPEAARLVNPVERSPTSIAAGRRIYQRMCERCHGPAGKGDGTSATGAEPPSDLTDDLWAHGSTDGEIYTVIHDGSSIDMDGYAGRVSDTDIWNVVNYLRSLGPAAAPAGAAPPR